jgi:hypothetical protein
MLSLAGGLSGGVGHAFEHGSLVIELFPKFPTRNIRVILSGNTSNGFAVFQAISARGDLGGVAHHQGQTDRLDRHVMPTSVWPRPALQPSMPLKILLVVLHGNPPVSPLAYAGKLDHTTEQPSTDTVGSLTTVIRDYIKSQKGWGHWSEDIDNIEFSVYQVWYQ